MALLRKVRQTESLEQAVLPALYGAVVNSPHSYRVADLSAFEIWFSTYGHWVYESRAEALAAWERGLA